MSTDVALPFLLVEVLPHDTLLLSSPRQSLIVSTDSAEVLYTTTYANPLQAPRCSSVHFIKGPQPEGEAADCLIALLGDDKELNVYKVSGLMARKVSVEKIYSSSLPKRGVKMVWEQTSKRERTLIVGDRHGDVSSFDIALNNIDDSQQVAKRRKTESNGKGAEEDDDDLDLINPPHLGHVSMLTDFVLTSFTSESPQTPASFIITSDRDEHIRISRWGKRRAGHLASRYLLGSTGAIGSICVIEHDTLEVLRGAASTDKAKEMCRQPLLISTDSSRLRIWSLHKDADASGRPDCLFVVDLDEAVRQYVKVDQMQEKNRQRYHGKGKDSRRKGSTRVVEAETDEATTSIDGRLRSIVMHRLAALKVDGDVYISFTVDGTSGLFTFSLSKMMSSSKEEAVTQVEVLDLEVPIVHQAIDCSEGNDTPCLWLACDMRQNPATQGLRRVIWSRADNRWAEDKGSNALLRNQGDLASKGTSDFANSLLLYEALTLYPKQEFELAASVQDAIGPNCLVRGGLSNFEAFGQYKGSAIGKKMNDQRTAGKKIRAREAMLRRIEQTLEGTDIRDSHKNHHCNHIRQPQ